jgi:hypothetical protein
MSFEDAFEEIITEGFRIESAGIEFHLLRAPFGDGFDASALVGSPDGLRSWSISIDVLPHLEDYLLDAGEFGLQTRALYLWEFFCRHKGAGDKSFVIVDPIDERKYFARFVDNKLTYQLLTRKLYSTGLELEQRRERGVEVTSDPVDVENTDSF